VIHHTAHGTAHTTRRRGLVALAACAAVGAVLVFAPGASLATEQVHRVARWLVEQGLPYWWAYPVAEFSLNVALFVPGTFVAALVWRRVPWWQWVLAGLSVSLFIELAQYALLTSRTAQVKDLVSNSVGAAVGAGLARMWQATHRGDSL
jgi:hypothetical protein